MRALNIALASAAALLLAAACGEKTPSNLTFEQVGGELQKGQDGFAAYLKSLPNRKIEWTGTVLKVRQWYEDDYMKAAGLLIDVDGKEGADAFIHVKIADIERLKDGARVSFVAEMTGAQVEDGRLIIELQARSLKP